MQQQFLFNGGTDRRAYGSATNDQTVKSGWPLGYELQDDEIIVDSFAGAGGMSCGIEWATGRAPDVAINHNPIAIATHEANHPTTTHYSASVYALDPREVAAGRKVGIFWGSPDCRSHSRARGSAPKSKSVRDLAWVIVHWAKLVRPRIIGVENVREFQDWCPLDENGKAIASKKGETFQEWVRSLEDLGYEVEWRILNAADFGAPTTRQRLFVQARCDGLPILWPEASHGKPTSAEVNNGDLAAWRTAAECIDYGLQTHSIFLTSEQAKIAGCKRPLADKTLRRIAKGMFRHIIDNPEPFVLAKTNHPAANKENPGIVVPLTHQGDDRAYASSDPFRTITGANRGELAWVSPYFARTAHGEVCAKGKKRGKGDHGPNEPYPTITSSNDSALICPTLVQTGYGERSGQAPRALDMQKPLGTVVAGGSKHAYVAAMLTCMNQNAAGSTPRDPLKTVMAGATRHVYIDADLDGKTDRSKEVAAFLWKYREFSDQEVSLDDVGTLQINGIPMRITDIGLRMLTGNELARAQGFDLATFDPNVRVEHKDGKKVYLKNTATQVVKMIGNSVAPPCGAAVIGAMIGNGIDRNGRNAEAVLEKLRLKQAA